MADNSQNNPSQSTIGVTPEDKLRNQELIGFLRQRLRLEGDYRDILRDSINESRKLSREIDRQNARIETANRETINLKDVSNEIIKIEQAKYITAQKLGDIQARYGITEENIAETLTRYSEKVKDKLSAESNYNHLLAEQNLLLDKIHQSGTDDLEKAKEKLDAIAKEKNLVESIAQFNEQSIKTVSNLENTYSEKLRVSQQQRLAAETEIRDLRTSAETELAKLQADILDAYNTNNDQLFDQLNNQYDQKQRDFDLLKSQLVVKQRDLDLTTKIDEETLKALEKRIEDEKISGKLRLDNLNNELSATKQVSQAAISAQAQEYVDRSQNIDAAEELLKIREHDLETQMTQMSEGQLAYVQGKEQETTLGKQLELTKQKKDLEKQVSNNIGISGGFAKMLADKLGIGNQVYGAMTLKAREIAEKEQKRKELNAQLAEAQRTANVEQQKAINEQLSGLGKQQGLLSTRFSVMKAGASGAFKSMANAMKDPVAMAGLIGAGIAAVSTGLNAVGGAARSAGNFMAGLSQHSSNMVRNLTSGISGLLTNIPLVGGLLAGLVDGASAFLDLLLGHDDYIVKAGRSLGISVKEARNLYAQYANINQQAQDTLIKNQLNSEQYYNSYIQLAKNLGVVSGISTEMVQQNAILQKRLGLTEQETAALTKTQIISGKTGEQVIASTIGQLDSLKKTTGVALNYKDVIKTVTNLSGVLGLQFAKYPDKIKGAVISTKALGMEIQKLDSVAGQFLDFESSISKEFEAQLLTGRDINLNTARQLALNNDLAGLAEEITNQLGDSDSFLKMNRIQQEAIAAAVGMSRDELGDVLKQQKLYSQLGVQDEKSYKEKIKYLREIGDTQERLNYEQKIGQDQLAGMLEQSALEDFEDIINKIKVAFVDFAKSTGFVEKFQDFVKELSKPDKVAEFLDKIKEGFAYVAEMILKIVTSVLKGIDALPGIEIDAKVIADLDYLQESVGKNIRNLGKLTEDEIKKGIEKGTIEIQDGKYFKKIMGADGKQAIGEDGKPKVIEVKQKEEIADKQKIVEQSLKNREQERGDVGTGGYLAAAGLGAAAGAIFGPIGAAVGAAGGLITAFVKDQLNEAKRATNESNAAYLNQTKNMSFSGGFGVSPSFYNATHPELLNSSEKHAEGGIFAKATTLIDPKTSMPHTFGEAGAEILTPLDKLEDYVMKPIDKMMQVVESKFDSAVSNAADFIKSNTTSDELDKIIDLTASILTGKSKEDNYVKPQPQVQFAQANQDKNIIINLNSTVKTNDVAIGKANERYAFQFAGSKIERVTGPLG